MESLLSASSLEYAWCTRDPSSTMIGFAAVPRAESLRGLEVLIEETEDSLVVWKSSSEEVN